MYQVLEGTWNEVSKQAATLSGTARVRLEVLEQKQGTGIRFEMFPELLEVTEEDFSKAKWHPKDSEE